MELLVPEIDQPFPVKEQANRQAPGPGKLRILWVDDDANRRTEVTRLLESRFALHAVANGEAALEAARAHPPDLIVANARMPKLDVPGLLRALRADAELQEIPIILLSAHENEASRMERFEADADDYLMNPFSARELLARIETHVRLSRVRREAKAALRESEHRFREFANAAPAVLWITGPDASCSFVSRGWYEHTGQSEESGLGFGWLEAVHPDDRDETKRILLEANRKQEAFSLDFRLRGTNGEFRWAMSSGRPRFHPDGTFAGFAGSVIDIHERKEAARASALLSAIVDSSDDAIVSKDLSGIIMSWNKAAERLFGYTAAEAVGQSIMMIIPPDRREEEPKILERLRRGERVDHFETIRVNKDGTKLNISLTISPVKDAEGRIIGASKIARDITDRVRREQALNEANAALRQANSDLQQFAYSASHDLQEPLRMVAAYSELLQRKFGGKLGPLGDAYIHHTLQGAMRLDNLLRDLRTYTQLAAGEGWPVHEVDAGEVLKKTLVNLELAIKDSGALVTSGTLPRVWIHAFQLEQVFQNLIANAIRYRSGAPPRVHVTAALRDNDWLFSVQDNGIGIEPEYKQQIFGIFKRLHSTAEYPGGTGMGLAICQRIIERNGGRIWVESEPGHGSTFYFTVPSRKPEQEASNAEHLIDSSDGRRLDARFSEANE